MSLRVYGHQHFWSIQRGDYGWLTPSLALLYRDFMPPDLKPHLNRAGIDRTVLVQAAPSIDETRFLLDIAKNDPIVAGVVGWINMDVPSEALKALDEFVKHPKFVGVRPMIQDIEDPSWIAKPELGIVLDALIENGKCFDALVQSVHLPWLLNCLTRHPELRVVIDHGAKPNIAGGEWQPWADNIAAIAENTNAYCKLSGLITETHESQSFDDIDRYFSHLLKSFGPERLMWGSDWPILNLSSDYESWHKKTTELINQLSEHDQVKIFGDNAIKFYKLIQ